MFLDQLIETLTLENTAERPRRRSPLGVSAGPDIRERAALHGRYLLDCGFTLEQVVRDYGDVCQAVTDLAFETDAPIEVDEFRTFNRCLDNAIAAAVTEYSDRPTFLPQDDLQVRPVAHELRHHLNTATLLITAIRAGEASITGATGEALDRSLMEARHLIDRELSQVRSTRGMPARLESIPLAKFLRDIAAAASFEAQARGCYLLVMPIDNDLLVLADPKLLASAVVTLLQNAFKFTKCQAEVCLHARAIRNRVVIEVQDHCGGLPAGATGRLLVPSTSISRDQSDFGLGLDSCRNSVEDNNGTLSVRNVPGSGCIFTINLPKHVAA